MNGNDSWNSEFRWIKSTEESPDETQFSLESAHDSIPHIGQRFVTHDTAYEFYSEFAKRCGFSIRRHRTEGKDGVGKGLTRRYFATVRVIRLLKCLMMVNPSVIESLQGVGALRSAYRMVCNWLCDLLEANQVRFLPAYRIISDVDKSRILLFAKTGISVQQMMRLMELDKCMEPGYLPFTEKDVRNLLQAFRKCDAEDEIIDLLRMCRNIKDRDPDFRFEFTVDPDNRLENIAWAYASSVQSYEISSCFFGCVLLRDEKLLTFSWALKAFLGFMNGKAPQTILTGQNVCLKEAISMVLSMTKSTLCIWMVVARFPSWFNAALGER